jgi:DNA polymerase III subunit delta'
MFDRLIGNEHVKDVIARFIRGGRLPNSLLFAGDDGVGKRQFALEIARSIVCVQTIDFAACGVCPACKRVDTFSFPTSDKGEDYDRVFTSLHPDIGMVIPFKRNVRIGAIRELEKEANFNPYEGPARFLIVDDAEKMADPAANALLKTLEEPPATSHIFLITSRPDSLLPTIRSRCQILRFAPVRAHDIERYLIDEHSFISEEATLAARLAGGSIGRAVSINVEQFRTRRGKMLGVVRDAISGRDRASMLRTAEEINDAKNKENFEEYLDILESLIHDVWTLRVSGNPARIVNTDLASELSDLAAEAIRSDFPAWLGSIETMRETFTVNINRRVATDALFISMADV